MVISFSATPLTELYARYRDYELLVDSRRLSDPQRTLFFALPGERTDGHDYVEELIGRGVSHFVIASSGAVSVRLRREHPEVNFIVASEPLAVLQTLAAHHRRQFEVPVVAITGSNGKTIVKDWLAELLSGYFRVCASPRSYNSQIGVPLSVWRLRPEHDLAIFEVGVSKSGEMQRLADIIRPTCGVFTVLGSAHDAGFRSREDKRREKLRLFAGCEWVVVPADDNRTKRILREMDVEIVSQLRHGRQLVEIDELPLKAELPDWPAVYLDNAATALATARTLGVPDDALRQALTRLQPLDNRLEQREGLHGGPVINDSYSNDLSALAAALAFAVAQNPFPDLTLILGRMQRGTAPEELRQTIAGQVTRLITVGQNPTGISVEAHYPSSAALLDALPELSFGRETILIKGASNDELGRVADALSRRQHRTVLRVDLGALQANFQEYRRRAMTRMIVMVKASAYGGGALPVARMLAANGADYLAVAYPDEGVALRRGGVSLPIMVLNAPAHSFDRMQTYALEPVVHATDDFKAAVAAGLRVHLEIDTGMGRLGFGTTPRELYQLLEHSESGAAVVSVFTHLAASEDSAHDVFTRSQLAAFDRVAEEVGKRMSRPPWRHALNTNGISRFPERQDDFVRLGIGLYGIGDEEPEGLRPALRLSARVTAVYDRPAGTTVGYGRRGVLDRDSRIAVLAIGYADGLPRLAGEGRYAPLIHSQPAAIVGSVCMDMTMVNVTDIPDVRVGDEAEIFGRDLPVEQLAEVARTIPYEILTGIGERVHRVYVQE